VRPDEAARAFYGLPIGGWRNLAGGKLRPVLEGTGTAMPCPYEELGRGVQAAGYGDGVVKAGNRGKYGYGVDKDANQQCERIAGIGRA